jgi:hypothetical protein
MGAGQRKLDTRVMGDHDGKEKKKMIRQQKEV